MQVRIHNQKFFGCRYVFLTSSSLDAGTHYQKFLRVQERIPLPVILWLKLMVLNTGDDLFALLGGLAEDGRDPVLVVVQGVHRYLRTTHNGLKKTIEKTEINLFKSSLVEQLY